VPEQNSALRRDILRRIFLAGKTASSGYALWWEVMAECRKLAAILAADVVGYSRLTGADEDRTPARLRALRSDLTDPSIAVHHGRVVKRTGDGALVEFRSVVDAVRCAIGVQDGMVERNAGVPAPNRSDGIDPKPTSTRNRHTGASTINSAGFQRLERTL
jgi:class 3 adenylate cyclase